MIFLDFEKPLETLYEQLEKVRQIGEQGGIDVAPMIAELEQKIKEKIKDIYSNLTGWDKVQLSRHPERPYSLFYVQQMCDKFIEMHGDRTFADDKAIVGGLGDIDGQTVVIVGHQKGINMKMRQYRNFGMANPEGYRKALRLMKMAEGRCLIMYCACTKLPDASLTPTNLLLNAAMRHTVSGNIFEDVRPGTLYKITGTGDTLSTST